MEIKVIRAEPAPRQYFRPPVNNPLDVRNAAQSIATRADRVKRALNSPATTAEARITAKDELALLLKEGRSLWELI